MSDARLTPIGFFNLSISYLDAADELSRRLHDPQDPLKLAFEHPVRHLYAHAWELGLKACLFAEGMKPGEMKRRIGHSLTKAWDAVDKVRFAPLKLHPQTRIVAEVLDRYHPTKEYAYPYTGHRRDFTVSYLRSASQRFRLSRRVITSLYWGKTCNLLFG